MDRRLFLKAAAAVSGVRAAVRSSDPELAISRVWTMRELMSRSMAGL